VGDFRVVYHEFLGEGFRRPVHVAFVENDRHVVFERQGGLGIYDTDSRLTRKVEVDGELRALDGSGGQGLMFAVFAHPGLDVAKDLVGIQVSGRSPRVVTRAPFRSEEVFLGRMGSRLIVGGGQAMVAFDLERR
ncbi:MAG: WD40 repeat domain-containing protein, partial [Treponema sp.]|nr:WD40 repeat domain-containing protein [Treponema sp.]